MPVNLLNGAVRNYQRRGRLWLGQETGHDMSPESLACGRHAERACYFERPFGSRFAFRSASVTVELTPSGGTSALAVHRIALSMSLR